MKKNVTSKSQLGMSESNVTSEVDLHVDCDPMLGSSIWREDVAPKEAVQNNQTPDCGDAQPKNTSGPAWKQNVSVPTVCRLYNLWHALQTL